MDKNEIAKEIEEGKACLGIEFGSTRIKAVLINSKNEPIASGAHDWENSLVDGVWTYSMDEILAGLKACYADMKKDVKTKYDVTLKKLGAMGISAMMHGYLATTRAVPHLAQHDYGRGKRETLSPFQLPHSRTLDNRAFVSSDFEEGSACEKRSVCNDARRLYPLETYGQKGYGYRRRFGDIPH